MKTFPIGGVHPSDNKQWSKAKAIEPMELPDVVTIPLAQHIGAPATALVKKGDVVKKDQVIGTIGNGIDADDKPFIRLAIYDCDSRKALYVSDFFKKL
jgi:electron transport complex protein RnfC